MSGISRITHIYVLKMSLEKCELNCCILILQYLDKKQILISSTHWSRKWNVLIRQHPRACFQFVEWAIYPPRHKIGNIQQICTLVSRRLELTLDTLLDLQPYYHTLHFPFLNTLVLLTRGDLYSSGIPEILAHLFQHMPALSRLELNIRVSGVHSIDDLIVSRAIFVFLYSRLTHLSTDLLISTDTLEQFQCLHSVNLRYLATHKEFRSDSPIRQTLVSLTLLSCALNVNCLQFPQLTHLDLSKCSWNVGSLSEHLVQIVSAHGLTHLQSLHIPLFGSRIPQILERLPHLSALTQLSLNVVSESSRLSVDSVLPLVRSCKHLHSFSYRTMACESMPWTELMQGFSALRSLQYQSEWSSEEDIGRDLLRLLDTMPHLNLLAIRTPRPQLILDRCFARPILKLAPALQHLHLTVLLHTERLLAHALLQSY